MTGALTAFVHRLLGVTPELLDQVDSHLRDVARETDTLDLRDLAPLRAGTGRFQPEPSDVEYVLVRPGQTSWRVGDPDGEARAA